jgi:hypothetical protein
MWHHSWPIPHPRRVAYKGCPVAAMPLFSFPFVLPRERTLEQIRCPLLCFLGLMSAPANRTVAATPSSRRHATVPPPSVSSAMPLSSAPFGSCLTSPVLSSSCRTRRRPPWPLELHHRDGLFSLPHRRWTSPVRTPPPHLASHNRCRSPVESPLSALHLGRRRRRTGRANTLPHTWPPRGDRAKRACSVGWHGLAVPLGQANSADAALCGDFLIFIFHRIFQKFV